MLKLLKIVLLAIFAFGCARADSLADVLARMDQAARDFKSFSANIKQVKYTSVLDETNEMNGTVRMKRNKDKIVELLDFSEPNREIIYINGRTVERYFPKANTAEIYDAGKLKNVMDQVLTLGFGVTSSELRKSYEIKLAGSEMVGQTHTTRIVLTPKSGELKKMVTRMDLWIPDGQGYPIQQKGTQPSQDYVLATYSDLKLNPSLADSALELNLPSTVKKNYPQR